MIKTYTGDKAARLKRKIYGQQLAGGDPFRKYKEEINREKSMEMLVDKLRGQGGDWSLAIKRRYTDGKTITGLFVELGPEKLHMCAEEWEFDLGLAAKTIYATLAKRGLLND